MNVEKLEQLYNKEIQKISDEINKSEEERIEKLSHLKTFEEGKEGRTFLKRILFSLKNFFKIEPHIAIFSSLMTILSTSILIFIIIFQPQKLNDLSIAFPLSIFCQTPFLLCYAMFAGEYRKKIEAIKRNKSKELIKERMNNPISIKLMKTFKTCFKSEDSFNSFLIGKRNVNYGMIKEFIDYKKDKNKVDEIETISNSLKEKEIAQ